MKATAALRPNDGIGICSQTEMSLEVEEDIRGRTKMRLEIDEGIRRWREKGGICGRGERKKISSWE